jgi:hypothetical protein
MLRVLFVRVRDSIGYTPVVNAERLTFTEFLDLCLVRVAEADAANPGGMVDLFKVNADLRVPVPEEWVYRAARLLDDYGYVKSFPVSGPVADVILTGDGQLYVEQGGDTDVIEEYQREPSQFVVNISGEGHTVAFSQSGDVSQSVREETNEILVLVSQIDAALDADGALSPEERAGFKTDLEAVRAQLQKPEPNRRAITALLEPMSNVSSVGSFVAQLLSMLT